MSRFILSLLLLVSGVPTASAEIVDLTCQTERSSRAGAPEVTSVRGMVPLVDSTLVCAGEPIPIAQSGKIETTLSLATGTGDLACTIVDAWGKAQPVEVPCALSYQAPPRWSGQVVAGIFVARKKEAIGTDSTETHEGLSGLEGAIELERSLTSAWRAGFIARIGKNSVTGVDLGPDLSLGFRVRREHFWGDRDLRISPELGYEFQSITQATADLGSDSDPPSFTARTTHLHLLQIGALLESVLWGKRSRFRATLGYAPLGSSSASGPNPEYPVHGPEAALSWDCFLVDPFFFRLDARIWDFSGEENAISGNRIFAGVGVSF